MTSSVYAYTPSHALPIVFAALIGISFLLHIWQNFRYHFWRVTFFMVWGGAVFTSGWIMRCISSYHPENINLYVAQTVLILAGPPIYSAAEYNVLGRLTHYLPMHAPLSPNRVIYLYIYLGAAVESLTAAGASILSNAKDDTSLVRRGGTLVASALVLQAVVELSFMAMVALLHYRCVRSKMLTSKVRAICIMLYGTSTLVILRCICRAIEQFSLFNAIASTTCEGTCSIVLKHEWYLYTFEAAPMLLYTYWLNIIHPGRLLPRQRNCYLDFNGVERLGPGWIDMRTKGLTFVDLFNVKRGLSLQEKYWLKPDDWPVVADDGSVQETAAV